MVLTPTQITNGERLTSLTTFELQEHDEDATEKTYFFDIHDVKRSENAILLFNNKYVFKILRPYKDHRYSLKELPDRQACLVEGWHWNRLFTRGIHFGLARLYNYDPQQEPPSIIELGKFLDPDKATLVKNGEYALVMRKLPMPRRLDVLLKNGDDASRQNYATVMTQFLVHIHTHLAFQLVSHSEKIIWGTLEQLKEKLNNNLVSVENPDISNESILISAKYRKLLSECKLLRETLLPIFTDNKYRELQQYFEQRINKQQVKRCHGDLKARNIWILHASNHQDPKHSEIWSGVRILDAVDFNPEFCNIDTLSDFAMLVADIHARTCSQELATSMIEDYLRLTKQSDKGSRFVLNYYLIEKAFVGALVSILYDKNWWLGQRYLDLCDRYLQELQMKLPHAFQPAPAPEH